MKTKTITLYEYDELSDAAKARAREWLRELTGGDGDLDYTLEDAARVCALLGVELGTHAVPLHGGGTRHDPNIWYSGFWSQGDGACFEGLYRYAKGSVQAIREYAPQDTELHRIARELLSVQAKYRYQVVARLARRDHHYAHEHTIGFEIETEAGEAIQETDEQTIVEALRSLMRWIYKQLQEEYEYQTSDEQIEESIKANGYSFTEDGKRED